MNDIYIKMIRPENYEDVCNELVIEDMHIHPDFQIEDVTQEIIVLRAEVEGLTRAVDTDYEQLYRETLEQLAAMTKERNNHELASALAQGEWRASQTELTTMT